MKSNYKLPSGQAALIEVNSAVAQLLAAFDREDKNAARNKRRHNEVSIEAMYEETGWEPIDTAVDIEAEYIASEEKEILLVAVSVLSEKQRRLIQLRYYEEKTESEIATILGVSQQAINRQLLTLHKKLKKLLEKTL